MENATRMENAREIAFTAIATFTRVPLGWLFAALFEDEPNTNGNLINWHLTRVEEAEAYFAEIERGGIDPNAMPAPETRKYDAIEARYEKSMDKLFELKRRIRQEQAA